MPYFLTGLLALLLILGLRGQFLAANPGALAQTLRLGGGMAGVAVGIALAGLGRSAIGLPLLFLGFTLLGQYRRHAAVIPAPSGPSGRASSVETEWLAMQLDHDAGTVYGQVRRGRFAGRDLATLSVEEVVGLIAECGGDDPHSAQLLTAWLDRLHPDWRQRHAAGQQPPAAAAPGRMSIAEAYEILGLQPGADAEAVQRAYRELMRRNHPDSGGSSWLAARINEARDVLLGR